MSFILDALKKADRDRQQAAVPTLTTVHRTPAPPSRRRLWPWIAGAVIVVNVGVWLWLLRPLLSAPDGVPAGVTREPATSPAPAAPEQATRAHPIEPVSTPDALDKAAVAVVPSQAPPSATRSAPSVPLSRLEQNPDVAPRAATKPAYVPSAGAAAPRSAVPPKPEPETAPEKSPTSATDSAPVKPMERGPATPPASQEPSTPEEVFANLHLQVHVYSEVPAQRRVFINNQKYVEGQRIDANLVIESITPDGVFVSYRGKRVLLRTDQSASH